MEMCKQAGNRIVRFFDDWTSELEYEGPEIGSWRERAKLKGKQLPWRISLVKIDITRMETRKVDLLQDAQVLAEIERYKWIESEIKGQDIGFKQASRDWLEKYADAWCRFHAVPRMPSRKEAVKMKKEPCAS